MAAMIKIATGIEGRTILDPDVLLSCPVPVYDTLTAFSVYAINPIYKSSPLLIVKERFIGPLGGFILRAPS
jgi:hypothetical protein